MASPGTYRGPSNGGDMAPFHTPLNSPMHYTAHDAALLCSGLGRLAGPRRKTGGHHCISL